MSSSDPPCIHAWGFSRWKRPIVAGFFPQSQMVFVAHSAAVPDGAALAVWGRQPLPEALQCRVGTSLMPLHLEDGFLRSVGLGADLVRPVSWVVDKRGIYFDATRPSDLEFMLQAGGFAQSLLVRASRLLQRIVGESLTKYNLAGRPWVRPGGAAQVLLVPGQVEGDASLRWGSPVVRSNLALLQAVRRAHPRAWIVYKPHPDVLAGLRARGSNEAQAAQWCDEVLADVPIDTVLRQVDAVHTMTSLTGFEALMRGIPVTCWGQPFYAGWGLTDDRHPPPRRTRRLQLDELVAGALLLYPRYVRRSSGQPCVAEDAVQDLLAWRAAGAGAPSLLQRLLRPALGWGKT